MQAFTKTNKAATEKRLGISGKPFKLWAEKLGSFTVRELIVILAFTASTVWHKSYLDWVFEYSL